MFVFNAELLSVINEIVNRDLVHGWRISSKTGDLISRMLAAQFSCPLKCETSRKLKNSDEPILEM